MNRRQIVPYVLLIVLIVTVCLVASTQLGASSHKCPPKNEAFAEHHFVKGCFYDTASAIQ